MPRTIDSSPHTHHIAARANSPACTHALRDPLCVRYLLTHTSMHCEQSSACYTHSHRKLGYHKERCGHRPCARFRRYRQQALREHCDRKALLASQALRATLCVLSSSTKGSLYIRNGQVPHIHTSTAGKHPARALALRANTLRAPTRCGPKPCARQQHLKGEEPSLGVLSGEKAGQGPRKATRGKGGARMARAALSHPSRLTAPTRTGRPRTRRPSPTSPPRQTRLAATAMPRWAAWRRVRLQATAPMTRHKH